MIIITISGLSVDPWWKLILISIIPVSPTVVLNRVTLSSYISLMISINAPGTFFLFRQYHIRSLEMVSSAFSKLIITICSFLSYFLYFSCSSLIQNMDSIVDLPFWNPYWLSLIFTIFLSIASITFSQSFSEWLKSLIPLELPQLRGSPFYLHIGLILLFLQSCGIPSLMIFLKHVIHLVPVSFSSLIFSTGKLSGPLALFAAILSSCVLNSASAMFSIGSGVGCLTASCFLWFLVFGRVLKYLFHLFLMSSLLLKILSSVFYERYASNVFGSSLSCFC